tara:strand:- start:488 stop:988 length:501 start_codon:yes stop_codon:yes gene_type:complete
MIQKINTGIPLNLNKRILLALFETSTWAFGSDYKRAVNFETFDAGFTLSSLGTNNSPLEVYGYVLLDIIQTHTPLKITNITRINWNWYNKNSNMEFHQDERDDNYYSMVYNLHTNDGGTEFKINDKVEFYPSVAGEALFFPSKIYHRGIAPKTTPNRFILNITGTL